MCAEFVSTGPNPAARRAVGIDLCSDELEQAGKVTCARLTPAEMKRVELLQGDVLQCKAGKAWGLDLVSAKNYRYVPSSSRCLSLSLCLPSTNEEL